MYQNNELINSNEMESLESLGLHTNLIDGPYNFFNKANNSSIKREVEKVFFKPLPSQ